MDITHEVYGEEIWAQYQGDDSYEIIEHDDGFFDLLHGSHTNFADYDEWPEFKKQAIEYARGNILDITQGAGSSSIYLQNQGFKVTAVQPSLLANKVCKERGLKNSHALPVDMIDKLGPEKFDTIILFGHHLGVFNTTYQAKKLFRYLYELSNPGAIILAENDYCLFSNDLDKSETAAVNHWPHDIPTQVRIRIRFKHFISEW
ncbi:MAG: hypothetical protein GF372_13435, partial [Candidatus Marinimicrobia bacterium]|nr:hypothetical protein [Candidatus Neomarinimicrobiota bacterium]